MKINIGSKIKDAIKNNEPVVALESTVLSHGLNYPENKNSYYAMADSVIKNGAIPACIAIIDGELTVGITNKQLERLCTEKNILKATTKDIPYACALKKTAATTVASTMFIAKLAGIKVFATGGIGGVHIGAENNFDISADLNELSKTSVIVVSAGAKAILDIPKTLEKLETLGVPVIGYKTDNFPCFWTNKSPYLLDCFIDNASQIADIYLNSIGLGLNNGFLVANPIPEKFSIPFDKIEKWVDVAIKEAKNKNITGKKVTPFLLEFIANYTKGESVISNLELLNSNCRIAAKISNEISKKIK